MAIDAQLYCDCQFLDADSWSRGEVRLGECKLVGDFFKMIMLCEVVFERVPGGDLVTHKGRLGNAYLD